MNELNKVVVLCTLQVKKAAQRGSGIFPGHTVATKLWKVCQTNLWGLPTLRLSEQRQNPQDPYATKTRLGSGLWALCDNSNQK
jgi:hypothetical protein